MLRAHEYFKPQALLARFVCSLALATPQLCHKPQYTKKNVPNLRVESMLALNTALRMFKYYGSVWPRCKSLSDAPHADNNVIPL